MFSEVIVEKIPVDEGTLIICRKYMALQTPDGVLHPADLDEYGIYQPVLEFKMPIYHGFKCFLLEIVSVRKNGSMFMEK